MHEMVLWLAVCFWQCDSSIRNFEQDALNVAPSHFTFHAPLKESSKEWLVVHSGGNCLVVRHASENVEEHVSLAIADKPEVLNVQVTARLKCGSEGDKNGGLVWRYQDEKNYLLARLDVSDGRVRLYRVVNGNRVKFGEENNLDLKDGIWYTLRVEHHREKIKVYLDGKALIVEKDKHFEQQGRVGFYANEDAETYFDDLEVRSLNSER